MIQRLLHLIGLEGMMDMHNVRPEIGVVGCKLLYDDDTIQHAGVSSRYCRVALHAFIGDDRDGPGYFNYINLLNNYSFNSSMYYDAYRCVN